MSGGWSEPKQTEVEMKEILVSIVLMVAISIAAAYGLRAMDWSAQSKFTSDRGSVRIN